MEPYRKGLKPLARSLRTSVTDAEQMQGVQFYRQKSLLAYIVDFYCSAAKWVVEINGSQHGESVRLAKDQTRDAALTGLGLRVVRFDNRQVLLETDAVLSVLDSIVRERLGT